MPDGLGAYLMNRTSISDLKRKAKDQLLGNYGIATGSFALIFVLSYAIMTVVTSAIAGVGVSNSKPVFDTGTIPGEIAVRVLGVVVTAISTVLTTGYTYVIRRIADKEKPTVSDLFYVFKNHPDKVVIISLIMTVLQFILQLPAILVGHGGFMTGEAASPVDLNIDGKKFLLWIVLYLAGFIVSFVIDLYLAMAFLIYLDDSEESVGNIIKRSIFLMRGNVLRYFYMLLTFAGYYVLIILSLGIAALWVVPYQTMAMVRFYYSIREDVYESGI